ncbi:hypothetical protein PGT21_031355 [Puccinia graminis f. sp. tritici]|uniref:Uncharacterized protein n=1 Tax=Puccinia graminis f. sp. tritici TaxID=56615 RepID=A0A5B0NTY6_PUCGR|nr:hypothetical protein PGTUg99_031980 [Puccinia graminis f. sp. tritici]KAA1091328.1 hypothetical protein PGT21_031355 [Puccinia graminis f. sp. tritici]
MKITKISVVVAIFSSLKFCKAPSVGYGIRQNRISEEAWVNTLDVWLQRREEITLRLWGNPKQYSVANQHLTFPVGATVSYGSEQNMIYITNQVNDELEYLMESLDGTQYVSFRLPPYQQDLVPGNAANIWVRAWHN